MVSRIPNPEFQIPIFIFHPKNLIGWKVRNTDLGIWEFGKPYGEQADKSLNEILEWGGGG